MEIPNVSSFDYAVDAVFVTFVAVVAVALERFYKDRTLIEKQNFRDQRWGWCNWRSTEVSYWSVLTVLTSLSLRFVIGSGVHLHSTIAAHRGPVRDFLWDILWLFLFGSFIVRAALADSVKEFAKWLMAFSIGGIIWSVIALIPSLGPHDEKTAALAPGWSYINGLQFISTFTLWKFSANEPTGQKSQVTRLFWLALVFSALFILDLCHIFDGDLWGCVFSVLHMCRP